MRVGTYRLGSMAGLLVLASLLSCKEGGPVSPPSTTTTTVAKPPRVDEEFSWDRYQGFSAFALEVKDVERVMAIARTNGWNTPRVCAETEFWDDDALFKRIPRDEMRVHELLDAIARVPGAQILLIPNCTLKGTVPLSEQHDWNLRVRDIVAGHYPGGGAVSEYKNVAVEVVNEPWHSVYRVPEADTKEMIRAWDGYRQYVGADDHFCGGGTFNHRYTPPASFASFHPCRSDENDTPWDPAVGTLQKLVARNNGLAVLSETVAYTETYTGGLFTQDRGRIQRYIDNCAAVPGCKFTFHSDYGLRADDYPWFPIAK